MTDSQKDAKVQKILLLEGSANVVVLIAKLVVGLTTGSLAILGDALHSLTDVANNIVAWAVVKHSQKPADKEHPYGHRKFETLAVLALAILLAVFAFELGLRAIEREATVIASQSWELAVMIGVLIINIMVASWQRIWAKRLDSDILHADASHTFADVLTTIVVIVGWQLSAMGYLWLDQLAAFLVALLILYIAFNLFKKVAPVLVDEYAVDPEKLTQIALQIEGVKGVGRVRSRWIGSYPSVDIIIYVAHHLTTQESHTICDKIEHKIELEFQVKDISIHVEPYKKSKAK